MKLHCVVCHCTKSANGYTSLYHFPMFWVNCLDEDSAMIIARAIIEDNRGNDFRDYQYSISAI